VIREIGMRRHVYGLQVARGKMDPQEAEYKIGIMEAIKSDYQDMLLREGKNDRAD
jgi:hypothetical protein